MKQKQLQDVNLPNAGQRKKNKQKLASTKYDKK